jgi:hypothetical protein
VAVLIYADVTRVTVRSGSMKLAVRKLNDAIRILQSRSSKRRNKININKCSTTLFSKRRSHIRDAPSPLKNFHTNINRTSIINYVGVIPDSKLNHSAHINRSFYKANNRLRQLYPILNKASPININLALRIYKSLIRSILTYAAPVWGYASKTHINLLQIFHKNVLRVIRKRPIVTPTKSLHEQTGMETIQTQVSRIATKLCLKSQLSDNPQIRQLGQYNPIHDKHERPRSGDGLISL